MTKEDGMQALIDELREENARLRAACQQVLDHADYGPTGERNAVLAQVQAALAGTEPKGEG